MTDPRREMTTAAARQMMHKLSPDAMRALRTVARMRNQPPEEVLRDELRDYIAAQLPIVDVEGIVRAMGSKFYSLGYTIGSIRGFLKNRP